MKSVNFSFLLAATAFAGLTTACSSAPAPNEPAPEPATTGPAPVDVPAPTDRPEMTAEACQAQGGTVVGDIGDGSIHKPDYKCPSGAPPIARVPLGIEGSVCCR